MNEQLHEFLDKPRDIADRKQFLADYGEGDSGDLHAGLKKFLRAGEEEIARRFFSAKGAEAGRKAARERAFLIDQLIRSLYDIAVLKLFPIANPTQGERLAILALGGYGRGELAPFSDIDLLFIQGYRTNAWAEQVVEYILYRLWDLGLRPGYAVRTAEEAHHWAQGDLIAKTSLLEMRYIAGEHDLFKELRREAKDFILRSEEAAAFIQAKLAERAQRLERFGQSRYNLQPNIKEGKGGLRDLHLLRWLAAAKGLFSLREVVSEGYLTELEAEQFSRAENLLWLYRTHLHYLAKRAEERLSFEMQAELAVRLNLAPRSGLNPVERLMRLYFRNARRVGRLAQSFLLRLLTPEETFPEKNVEGFIVRAGRLEAPEPSHFQDKPRDLLRIFYLAQKLELPIGPVTLALAQKAAMQIDDEWRADLTNNQFFLDIIRSPYEPERWLHRLNETGILGRFLPDFGRIIDQVQFDMYHHYTVDEHTIHAIGELDRLLQRELGQEMPSLAPLAEVMHQKRPPLLFLAVLLHDIAKGRDRDHSEVGAEIALELGPRFGLTSSETDTLSWLVRYHLLMSNTAFRRNLDDLKTIETFARKVENVERLDLLLLLTIADIRAVGPKTWTSWKAQLLSELYRRSREELEAIPIEDLRGQRERETRERLQKLMRNEGIPDELINFYLAHLPSGYLLSFAEKVLLDHYGLISILPKTSDALIAQFQTDAQKAVTKVVLICRDRKGLVAQLAGAFALAGADIINAQIFTLPPDIALDIFVIQNRTGEAFPDHKFAELEMKLRNVLANPEGELKRLKQMPLFTDPVAATFPVVPRVRIDDAASDHFTVIEVAGRDKRGLVHGLASRLTALHCSIASAKVSTFGHRAIDTFYITGPDGRKVQDEKLRQEIAASLMEVLKD